MKNFKLLAVALLAVPFANAQSMADAIKKTNNERYDAATADFQKLIAAEPENSKLYFYYGENLFEQGQPEKAKEQWDKGLSINPKCELNMIGEGKYTWYKGDTTAGRANFNNALASTKNKNAEVMRQISEVLIEAPKKDLRGAIALLDKAIKLEPKDINNRLLKGDALLQLTPADGSPAIAQYNEALYIDPSSAIALVKTAQLYQGIQNYKLANEKYLAAQAADPNFAPAYRMNGELNILFNRGQEAADNYRKYLALNNDTDARYRYASALFLAKSYCDAETEMRKVESEGFSNSYTKRIIAVSAFECNSAGANSPIINEQALKEMNDFFAIAKKEEITYNDYVRKGNILKVLGQDSLAVMEYEKAVDFDPANAKEAYAALSEIYGDKQDYSKQIALYDKKSGGDYTKLSTSDLYSLGKAHYFGSKDYVKADSAFAILNQKDSTYAAGYIWRARAVYKADDPKNPKFLAQPHYQNFLDKLPEEDKLNPDYASYVTEAAKYLGDYYVRSVNKDAAKAKEYWGLVRTINPNDKQAIAFFASPMGK